MNEVQNNLSYFSAPIIGCVLVDELRINTDVSWDERDRDAICIRSKEEGKNDA